MKYLLLLAALCWPVRADEKGPTIHVPRGISCIDLERNIVVEGAPCDKVKWIKKPRPLTTRWFHITTNDYPEGSNPKECDEIVKTTWVTPKKCRMQVIELGLRSDGVVVWR